MGLCLFYIVVSSYSLTGMWPLLNVRKLQRFNIAGPKYGEYAPKDGI